MTLIERRVKLEQKIEFVSLNEILDIKKKIEKDNSLFLAEINKNNDVQLLQDYLDGMKDLFQFPFRNEISYNLSLDGYYDWMRDLDWLDKDGYILVIYNYNDLLNGDLEAKRKVIYGLIDTILPFWKEEVLRTVVEGIAKTFIVYLVF
jgi:hypothetical protein